MVPSRSVGSHHRTYQRTIDLPDGTTIAITEALLQSELRCIAVAVKLMGFGYFQVTLRSVSRIDIDDWLEHLSNCPEFTICSGLQNKAHIFRMWCSQDTLLIPEAIARHIHDSENISGRYV